MKQLFAFLIAVIISASVARGGDVKVKVTLTTGPEDEPVTSFTADTPKLFAIFKTKGIKNGDKVRGVLIAEHVGDAAPANTKVLEQTLTADADMTTASLGYQTDGWLAGGQIPRGNLCERRVGDDGEVHDQSRQIEEKVGRGIRRFGEIKTRIVGRLEEAQGSGK